MHVIDNINGALVSIITSREKLTSFKLLSARLFKQFVIGCSEDSWFVFKESEYSFKLGLILLCFQRWFTCDQSQDRNCSFPFWRFISLPQPSLRAFATSFAQKWYCFYQSFLLSEAGLSLLAERSKRGTVVLVLPSII